jgi:hypothetical protein
VPSSFSSTATYWTIPFHGSLSGGFSPKESIYDEASTIASHELPLRNNEFIQKPLDGKKILSVYTHNVLVTSPSTLNENVKNISFISFLLFFPFGLSLCFNSSENPRA